MNNFEVTSFLADSVDLVNGKIYALGIGWNTIFTPGFPIQHPRVGLGVLVNVPYTYTNEDHTLEITLQDEDGNPIPLRYMPKEDGSQTPDFKFSAQFRLGRPPALPAGDPQLMPLAINFDGLILNKASMFRWVIEIDGNIVGTNSMRVVNN